MVTFSINSDIHKAIKDVLNNSSLDSNLAYMNEGTTDAVVTLALSSIEKPENTANYLDCHEKCNPVGYLKALERNTKILDSQVDHFITQNEYDKYIVGVLEGSISDNSSLEESVINNTKDIYDDIMLRLMKWEDEIMISDARSLTKLLQLNLTRESRKAFESLTNLINKYENRDLKVVIFDFLDSFQALNQEHFIRFHRNLVNDLDSLYLEEGKVFYCD